MIIIQICMLALLVYGSLWKDFSIYQHRGYAQPDDESDTTLITGPGDANSLWQIDRFKEKTNVKKK